MKKQSFKTLMMTGCITLSILAGCAMQAAAEAEVPETTGAVTENESGEAAARANAEAARNPESGFSDLLNFRCTTLEDASFTQEDLKDRDITILYIWSTTCGYCVNEMPELAVLDDILPENIQMVSFCTDASRNAELATMIMENRGFSATTITGGEDDFSKLYGEIMYTPTTLFLDSEGYIVGEPLIGAPKDLFGTYEEYLNNILEKMELEPLDLKAAAEDRTEAPA